MYLFAISDATAAQLITAVFTLCGTLISGVLAYLMAKFKAQQELAVIAQAAQSAAAVKATEDVKNTLKTTTTNTTNLITESAEKIENLRVVAKATHTLVNSNMEIQLNLNKVVTRRLADFTKDSKDIETADLAERTYNEHVAKQKEVDKQPGSDAQKKGD